MKISTITVCYNSAATIRHTVGSFLAQDYPHKELVIVDGASKDGTLDIVRSFGSDLVRIHSAPDKGIYDAMNTGLRLFAGDAVGFLNSDDCYASPASLGRIAEGLRQAETVCGDLDFVEDHVARKVVRRWRGAPFRKGGFARGWMPAHPTFYMRREIAEAVGQFDLSMRISADYDYMLRALEVIGASNAHLSDTLVHMMVGGNSTAGLRAYLKGNLESLRSRRRWLGSGPLDYAMFAKPLGKLPQFFGAGR